MTGTNPTAQFPIWCQLTVSLNADGETDLPSLRLELSEPQSGPAGTSAGPGTGSHKQDSTLPLTVPERAQCTQRETRLLHERHTKRWPQGQPMVETNAQKTSVNLVIALAGTHCLQFRRVRTLERAGEDGTGTSTALQ